LLEIARVLPGSAAARLGLASGDALISVNGEEINDCIDYAFTIADEHPSLVVKKKDGSLVQTAVPKEPDDDLGLEFAPLRVKRCRNRCVFCFVDQMPKGCRRSLYVKDDDFRASFLFGNYITLGALTEGDWNRIFSQRLSPLYVSVHATDPSLRSFILRNKKAPDIMTSLKRLAAGGIRMHAQIVTCPGINDGPHLARTVEDLAGLFPAVASIAVVPVGLTANRKGLFPLKAFTPRGAKALLESVERLGATYKKKFGTRLVFASDEFYVKAGKPVPPASFYEDFPQIENGVGMVAEFLGDARRTKLPARVASRTVTIVTGASFCAILKGVLQRLKKVKGASIRLVTVKNRFFGPSVTVAGLLTGQDILKALRGRDPGALVVIPAHAVKEDEDVFLDGMTLAHLERALGAPVRTAGTLRELVAALRGEEDRGK
jgi:putative radical SAM enzyme (TIGR03279 family)